MCSPFDGVTQRYTIGSADTHGYLFLVGYHEDTIFMEYQHSISDGRGFEEFIRCVLFHYLKACGHPVENDGTVRATDSAFVTEESEDAFRKLDAMEPSPAGIYQKPAALHADGLTWDNDSPEVVSEITFPLASCMPRQRSSESHRCLSLRRCSAVHSATNSARGARSR